MENSRRLVLFPTDQFYAIVGTIRMREDPYLLSIPDIFNDKSAATHWARDHEHKPGKLFLSETTFFSLYDNTQRACPSIPAIHISLKNVRGAIDLHPGRYQGNDEKRKEYGERTTSTEIMRFTLHDHALSGMVDMREVYRRSEQFVGVNGLHIDDQRRSSALTLPEFLDHIDCPHPEYMAVHLGNALHT